MHAGSEVWPEHAERKRQISLGGVGRRKCDKVGGNLSRADKQSMDITCVFSLDLVRKEHFEYLVEHKNTVYFLFEGD